MKRNYFITSKLVTFNFLMVMGAEKIKNTNKYKNYLLFSIN